MNADLLIDEKVIFSNKIYRINGQNLLPLTKNYLDFYFLFSLELLILVPTRVTSKTATLIDHLLTNSSLMVTQCHVIELGISDHNLIYCTRKTYLLKCNKHIETCIRLMKNNTKEKILELLTKIDFPDYNTCLNVVYQDFIFELSEVIDLLWPSQKLTLKANLKPRIDS